MKKILHTPAILAVKIFMLASLAKRGRCGSFSGKARKRTTLSLPRTSEASAKSLKARIAGHTLKIGLFFLLFTIYSCGDELPNPNNYPVFPMDLKVEPLPNGGYRYSWNKINSSDFISYSLVGSSSDSVPYVSSPNLLPSTTGIIQIFTDPNITSFIDSFSIPTGKPHVRLFTFLKGRSLSSINKKLTPIENIKEFNMPPTDFIYSEKKKTLVVLEAVNTITTTRDLNSARLHYILTDFLELSLQTNNVSFFRDNELYIGELSLGTEVFVPSSNGFGYTSVNLDSRTTNSISTNNSSIFTFKSPTTNLWWLVNSSTFGINSTPRIFSNTAFTTSVQPIPVTSTIISTPFFLRLKNDGRTFLALKPNVDGANTLRIFNYEILNDGRLQLLKAVTTPLKINTTFTKSTPFIYTKDDAYFICDNKGLVFNTLDYTKYKALAEEVPTGDNINYLEFVLNTEGGKIYALRNGLRDKKNRVVDIFTYPDFKHERSISYKSTPTKLIVNSNYLLLVGVSPNNSRATMIEKINL